MQKQKKPRIVIEPTGAPNRPYLFKVKLKGEPWKNSQWFTFDEALVAAGVKDIHSLPAASDLWQGFACGGVIPPGATYIVGNGDREHFIPSHHHA